MNTLTCNCYHEMNDHHVIDDCCYHEKGKHTFEYDGTCSPIFAWCRWSEVGQCPCDAYTPLTNLEWLEWKDETKRHDQTV